MSSPAVESTGQVDSTQLLSACPLCAGRAFSPLPTPGGWIGPEVFGPLEGRIGLMRCRGCRLVFVNPRPSREQLCAFYDSVDASPSRAAAFSGSAGARADFLNGKLEQPLTPAGALHLLDRIERSLPKTAPRTLLECGAGAGAFLLHARARGWQVRGLEPGRRAAAICRAAGLDIADWLEELPSGAFGLVVVKRVFGQLTDPAGMMAEARRLLAPDGRLFIEVMNVGSLRARLSLTALSRHLNVDQRYRAFPTQLAYYDPRTLRSLLAKERWTLDDTFTIGLGLDELVVRPATLRDPAAHPGAVSLGVATKPPRRRWRHALRDAFLDLGLGENLGVIARRG